METLVIKHSEEDYARLAAIVDTSRVYWELKRVGHDTYHLTTDNISVMRDVLNLYQIWICSVWQ